MLYAFDVLKICILNYSYIHVIIPTYMHVSNLHTSKANVSMNPKSCDAI